jgi:hypothetical protein
MAEKPIGKIRMLELHQADRGNTRPNEQNYGCAVQQLMACHRMTRQGVGIFQCD